MKYLHTMVRVRDLDAALDFYCAKLGLIELRRSEHAAGRYTLVFLAAPGDESAQVELTYNWDPEELAAAATSGTSRTRSTTSTRPASACWTPASSSIALPATAQWRSFARRTASQSSCCRPAKRCRPRSREIDAKHGQVVAPPGAGRRGLSPGSTRVWCVLVSALATSLSLCAAPSRAAADPAKPTRIAGPCPGCRSSLPAGDDPAPLLVLLHGDGESAGTMFTAWAPAAEPRGIAVLSIECPRAEGCTRASFWRWNGSPSWIVAQMHALGERRSHDPSRAWIVGWSGGGSYIGWKTQELERTFAALVIHGGGIPPEDPTCPSTRASVYFLVGTDNPLHDLARRLHEHYLDCQQDVTWTLLRGAGHPAEWQALSARRAGILDWLSTKRLSSATPPPVVPDTGPLAVRDAGDGDDERAVAADAAPPSSATPPVVTTPSPRPGSAASCRCGLVGSSTSGVSAPSVFAACLAVIAFVRRRGGGFFARRRMPE